MMGEAKNMFLKFKDINFLIVSLFLVSFYASAQNLNLMPPKTDMLNKNKDVQELVTSNQYQYSSLSSKAEILDFYRKMFDSEGFKLIKAKTTRGEARKNIFSFTKQKEGIMAILIFLGRPIKRESAIA